MTESNDRIKAGIIFEEDVIHVLSADIQELQDFKDLPETVRKVIIEKLESMKADSERHRQVLLDIAKKY